VYFNNYNSKSEQRIFEDLIVESIKIQGFDGYYLPNTNDQARDLLFGEDPVKKFEAAFPVELYLSNFQGYEGQEDFFSKFGLEIKNNVKVILSRRTFEQRVPQNAFTRPREGDLIYVPFLNGYGELFEITFTEQAKDFFQLGRQAPYFYELSLEKYKFSQEKIDTGVYDIDLVTTESGYTIDLDMNVGTGNYIRKEVVYQSADHTHANATVVALVSKWNANSNTLSVTNISGEFVDGVTVYGASSNAHWTIQTFDPMEVNVRDEIYDNRYIQNQGDSIIDFSETNPFGNL
jgi:hypothetical protein